MRYRQSVGSDLGPESDGSIDRYSRHLCITCAALQSERSKRSFGLACIADAVFHVCNLRYEDVVCKTASEMQANLICSIKAYLSRCNSPQGLK